MVQTLQHDMVKSSDLCDNAEQLATGNLSAAEGHRLVI